MKLVKILLATALCASSTPLVAEELTKMPSTTESSNFQPPSLPFEKEKDGTDVIHSLRQGYEAGQYDSFLSELDNSYQKIRSTEQFKSFTQFRGEISSEEGQKWTASLAPLQETRNQALVELMGDNDSPFADKVRFSALELSTPEQKKAIAYLSSLRHMVFGSGKNSDENLLIELDLEYEYKSVHVDTPSIEGQATPERREMQAVLEMEKMDKMSRAAEHFTDSELRKSVEIAEQNFDIRLAQKWDQTDLSILSKQTDQLTDPLKKKVASILQGHQEKVRDLSKQFFENGNRAS